MTVEKEWLDFLRDQYPKGSRIRLIEMKGDPYPIAPGSMGTLEDIDDAGQFHVKWDNGSGLALIFGEDRFRVLPPEPQTLKFYMPLTAQLYGRDEWGDLEEYGEDLDGRSLRDYQSCIHETMLENDLPNQIAQAADFVRANPKGLDAPVEAAGKNFSGGQRQRLTIARALVGDPAILILDDSASALDFKTDAALRAALRPWTKDSTVLIVAQRVSTIMHAQQIIVLDEGRVVGKGTHEQLLKSCPEYREIAQSQLSKEELA